MIKGVIFDLDGVIVSTDHFHYVAWKKLADREGIYFDEKINNRLRGVSRLESLKIVLEKSHKTYSDEEIAEMLEYKNNIYRASLINITPSDILPGVVEFLDWLDGQGIKKAIGSSSKNTDLILTQIGLKKRFEVIVDGTCITNTKPDPEVFVKAQTRLGLQPQDCLVVEDAIAGVEAAHRAGIKACAVGDASLNKVGDWNVNNILEIIEWIK